MHIQGAVLASDSGLDIARQPWNSLTVPAVPMVINRMIAVVVAEVRPNDLARAVRFTAKVLDGDDYVVGQAATAMADVWPPAVPLDFPLQKPVVFSFDNVPIAEFGRYRLEIRAAGEQLASLPFMVTRT